ncbi:MAG TPA: LamG domain-containing protein [Lacipirellulaceae bacterium]|nr:LamG domain-containing protein [Lacipirellulaceae bacterium]
MMRPLSCFLVAMLASVANLSPAATLVSHYRFDGNTHDSVPGGPAGVIVDFNPGSPTSGLGAGRVGSGSLRLEFGDYMSTTTAGRPTGDDFDAGTIAFWIKTAPNLTNSQLANVTFMGTLNSGADQTAYLLGTNGVGNLQLFPRAADGSQSRPRLAPGGNVNTLNREWADGQWHHIAISFSFGPANGSTMAQWYINGVAADTNIAEQLLNSQDIFNPWEFDMIIGGRNNRGAPDQFLPGGLMLDDIRIYNGVLSPVEIAALAALPEPSAICLLGVGATALLRSSRRRGQLW